MAVRTSCPHCEKPFSAPEDYLGRKVECPRCGRKSVLRTPQEAERATQLAQEEQRRLEEDREKIAFLEEVESRNRHRERSYYEEYGAIGYDDRYHGTRSPSRSVGLRALANFLLVGAYLELFVAAVGVGVTGYLWLTQWLTSTAVLVLILIAWALLGISFFFILKCLGELAHSLADLSDQQGRTLRMLFDARYESDRR